MGSKQIILFGVDIRRPPLGFFKHLTFYVMIFPQVMRLLGYCTYQILKAIINNYEEGTRKSYELNVIFVLSLFSVVLLGWVLGTRTCTVLSSAVVFLSVRGSLTECRYYLMLYLQ